MVHDERIQVRDVSKTFTLDGKMFQVLKDVNLSVNRGEFVSVVGPSGSGKTTLLNIVGGFEAPDTGGVAVDGRQVDKPGPERGVIFQQYALFPWLTVKQNIGFGLTLRANKTDRTISGEIVNRYIDLMGLQGFEDAYPKSLSGGMKQRVAIARAYAVQPDILLMDEPFAALDAQTRGFMQELLLDVLEKERKTVLFITHSVEEAILLSGRVVVMSSRPAEIREIADVPFPYPRKGGIKTSTEFLELRQKIEELVREQYVSTKGDDQLYAPTA